MGLSVFRTRDLGSSQSTTPAGAVLPYAGAAAPTGWLLCFGQAVSRTTYSSLFAVLGTTYGSGDGSTTFNLPDMRGRVPAGLDNMGGSAASRLTNTVLSASNTLGATGGTQTYTLSTSEMPSHTHTQDPHYHWYYRVTTNGGAVSTIGDIIWAVSGGNVVQQQTGYLRTESNAATNQNTGGGAAHPITQPTIVLNYIIKV